MGIGGVHNASLQQSVVLVDGHQRLHDKHHEAQVVHRVLARTVKQHARVRGQAPITVLAAAVDASERLLVEQATEAMVAGHFLHQGHEEHIVVNGQVGLLEDGSQLKLVGCHLVVTGLARDAQLQCLVLQVFHESLHTLWHDAEIVVFHLLVLGGVMPHQGASRQHQVGTCHIKALVYQEVFLLPSQIGNHLFHLGVKIMTYLGGGHVHGMERAQQWRFVVERLARIRNEDSGDTERVVHDKHR